MKTREMTWQFVLALWAALFALDAILTAGRGWYVRKAGGTVRGALRLAQSAKLFVALALVFVNVGLIVRRASRSGNNIDY
ncbi:MAG: hypothetical protein GF331_12465 [Chitinivibrionales bacterium]|nr:hypothetical protein [Chitinivibrionales bacterium]